MTGFGSSSEVYLSKKISVDIKSLNSKQLDLNCRMPFGLRSMEPEIRKMIAAVAERGKLDVNITIENIASGASATLNANIIRDYKERIENLSEQLGVPAPTDWMPILLRLPDALTTNELALGDEETEGLQQHLLSATRGALNGLMEYRRAEGVKLEEFFAVRIERIRNLLLEVPRYENERVERIKNRMMEALAKIPAVEYDRARLEQEMIYYIEKLDVNEEKQRLAQHLDYFMETMAATNGGQGKKLGFIAQEMTREINTLGSKSNHAEMQNLVVKMKDELEQIKEQVLNVM